MTIGKAPSTVDRLADPLLADREVRQELAMDHMAPQRDRGSLRAAVFRAAERLGLTREELDDEWYDAKGG